MKTSTKQALQKLKERAASLFTSKKEPRSDSFLRERDLTETTVAMEPSPSVVSVDSPVADYSPLPFLEAMEAAFPRLSEEQRTFLFNIYRHRDSHTLPKGFVFNPYLNAYRVLQPYTQELVTLAFYYVPANWPYLKELSLCRNDLTFLPEGISQLKHLQKLDLSHNAFTVLPKWIGELTELQELNLSNTSLTTIAGIIGNLTKLESLDLAHTQFTDLPEALRSCTNLQKLELYNPTKPLTILPEWIGELTNLQHLALNDSELTTIPSTIGNLTKLQTLDLTRSTLTSLPEEIEKLTNLQRLYLLSNKLTSLPEGILKLANLKELVLEYNAFTKLPEAVGTLASLKTLAVTGNPLISLPISMGGFPVNSGFLFSDIDSITFPPDATLRKGLKNGIKPFMQCAYDLAEVKAISALRLFTQVSKRCYTLAYGRPLVRTGELTAPMAETQSLLESLPHDIIKQGVLPYVMEMSNDATSKTLTLVQSEPFQKLSHCEKLPDYLNNIGKNWQERMQAEYEKKFPPKPSKDADLRHSSVGRGGYC